MNLVRSWPQGQAGPTPLGWRPPQPLMPPRINGWPQGVVPSSDAEALLESAVAWWDASRYRDGDRWLRNQGVAGELLDLRLGSSITANSNDPQYLAPADQGYAYLPGVSGNFLSVPNESALQITGDIDIIIRQRRDVSATATAVGKQDTGDPAYEFLPRPTYLRWAYYDSVTLAAVNVDSVAYTLPIGDWVWLRVTFDADNGASGTTTRFYWAPDSIEVPTSWTEIGNGVVTAGTATIRKSSAPLRVGAGTGGTSNLMTGAVGRVIVKDGIDGTTVLDVDCDALTSGSATSFTATTGQTVTINRSTSGRKSVAQPARGKGGRALFLLGTDDYFEVPSDRVWQHQLLNFGQGDSFTVLIAMRLFSTQANYSPYLSKNAANTASVMQPRWQLSGSGTDTNRRFLIDDGVASVANLQATSVNGAARLLTGTVTASTATVRDGDNTQTSSRGAGSLVNQSPVRVGRTASTTYADMELFAAAIWRRALSAAEIASITRYYGAS